ncbi:TlyA family RNA methyltransferase [Candidatus Poribacteria bacterium]|nr:TlyA family RNA methyltransferase [Candidatus Poribacteria bacterium]
MPRRLDVIMVERGLVANLEEAKRLIMAGKVLVNGQKADKPGKTFSVDSPLGRSRGWVSIEIQEDMPYVSRGGLKLEKSLRDFNINVRGKVATDIGASTGGFTDCLLQHGAKFVYAIDVGYGQLAWKLRHDPRVKVLERTNIRYVQRSDFDKRIELATIDVSFISLRKVLPVVVKLFNGNGEVIALIKPQFEANRHLVEKGGVVKDPEVHKQVIAELIRYSTHNGFTTAGLTYSPITGPAGNIEYFIFLKLGRKENNIDVATVVPQIIHEAHIQTSEVSKTSEV